MIKSLPLVAVLAFALALAGCKKDHETLAKDMVGKFQEMANVLKTVKDKDSANAAAPRVKGIVTDLQEIKKQDDALGKPSAETDKKIKAEYEKPVMDAVGDIMKEGMRIQMAGLMTPELQAAMQDMGKIK
jgi:hypothetical protein